MIAIIAGILGRHIWKYRETPGSMYFSILMAAISVWAVMVAGEISATDEFTYELFSLLSYICVTWAGPLWLLFVLDYGYRDRWPITWKTMWIWAVPAIIVMLAITNEWHGLIWRRSNTALMIFDHGAGLWANLIYTYMLLLVAFALLTWTIIRSRKKNYLRIGALLLGTLAPTVTSVLWMIRLFPVTVIDLTPIVIGITILFYSWSVFGQNLFDIKPTAREVLVRSMADGVLVLDQDRKVVDINPAAMRMLNGSDASIGQQVDVVLSDWPEIIRCCYDEKDMTSEILSVRTDRWIEIQASMLCDKRGNQYGRLIAVRDITGRKLAEEEIKKYNESLQTEIVERKLMEEALRISNKALQTEVAERKHAEESLAVSLKEKELLLKEIHHRVKNNLQIISSLLSLQTINTTDINASASLRDTQNRIKSMALIHEKLYRSRDLARIDFKEYVQSLVVSLTRSYTVNPGVRISIDIGDVALDIDTAIPCGLIINELISNSLKYAFKGEKSGEIKISLTYEDGLYKLRVSDDGIGLPPEIDFRNTPSLGLQLVVTLTEQLKGSIEHITGKGTMFVITFRENNE